MRRCIREHNILFLCQDNACLSQMAEAAAKHLGPPQTRIFCAGVKPSASQPQVIRVMEELGISMCGHSSKGLTEVPVKDIDLIVSFDEADKQCSGLPSRARIKRWPVSASSRAAVGPTAGLSALRNNRDEIDKRVFALFLDHWRNLS